MDPKTTVGQKQQLYETKVLQLRELMRVSGWNGIVLSLTCNFAWLTNGGRNYIPLNTESGVAVIYIPIDGDVALVTNNIEGERLMREEVAECPGLTLHESSWWEHLDFATHVQSLAPDVPDIVWDTSPVLANSHAFRKLRLTLSPFEQQVYQDLGQDCARLISKIIRKDIRPGLSEYEIAAILSHAAEDAGIDPIVQLIAVDDRIDSVRHPLPSTSEKLKHRLMIVLCGRRHGLICSLTRLAVYGGSSHYSPSLQAKHFAVTKIDAAIHHTLSKSMLKSTTCQTSSTTLFRHIQEAYAAVGYPDEWQYHHQGGATGYECRAWFTSPTSAEMIEHHQAYAFNPSISGTKSEDTIFLSEDGQVRVLSTSDDWPMITHVLDGQTYARPDILVMD